MFFMVTLMILGFFVSRVVIFEKMMRPHNSLTKCFLGLFVLAGTGGLISFIFAVLLAFVPAIQQSVYGDIRVESLLSFFYHLIRYFLIIQGIGLLETMFEIVPALLYFKRDSTIQCVKAIALANCISWTILLFPFVVCLLLDTQVGPYLLLFI